MSREIKFRGKAKCNGDHKLSRDWIYGNLLQIPNDTSLASYLDERNRPPTELVWAIQTFNDYSGEYSIVEVDENTVGQFIEYTDSCGNNIYTDDIVSLNDELYKVRFDAEESMFILESPSVIYNFGQIYSYEIALVGNTHDDHELEEKTREI